MTVGERIRSRLAEVGLSQSELARRVSLTQGTIAGLISGRSRSSSHLHKIARVLGTTPAYLSGETNDPDEVVPTEPTLDSETRELNEKFALMHQADRRALLQIARSIVGAARAGATVHDGQLEFRTKNS